MRLQIMHAGTRIRVLIRQKRHIRQDSFILSSIIINTKIFMYLESELLIRIHAHLNNLINARIIRQI